MSRIACRYSDSLPNSPTEEWGKQMSPAEFSATELAVIRTALFHLKETGEEKDKAVCEALIALIAAQQTLNEATRKRAEY